LTYGRSQCTNGSVPVSTGCPTASSARRCTTATRPDWSITYQVGTVPTVYGRLHAVGGHTEVRTAGSSYRVSLGHPSVGAGSGWVTVGLTHGLTSSGGVRQVCTVQAAVARCTAGLVKRVNNVRSGTTYGGVGLSDETGPKYSCEWRGLVRGLFTVSLVKGRVDTAVVWSILLCGRCPTCYRVLYILTYIY